MIHHNSLGNLKKIRIHPEGTVFLDEKTIMKVVSDYFKIPLDEITKGTRFRRLVTARQIMMYFISKHTRLTYKEIGQLFSCDDFFKKKKKRTAKDHTSVIHSCQRVKELIDTDDQVFYDIKELNEILFEMKIKINSEKELVNVAAQSIHLLLNLRNAEKAYVETPCFNTRTNLRRWQEMSDNFLLQVSGQEYDKSAEVLKIEKTA